MTEILTKCGYRCDLCPAYFENLKSDAEKIKLSESWKRIFGFQISPGEIECVGCHNEGRHPDQNCPVRPCVIEKGFENCAHCDSFGCERLKTRMDFLEDYIYKQGQKFSDEDYKIYIQAYESKPRLMKIRDDIKNNQK